MSDDPSAPAATTKKRVLIIEDNQVAADHLKRKLTALGGECVLLVRDNREEFEAEFERQYPPRQAVAAEAKFDGTILDVIFDKFGGSKQLEGGRDLYQWLRMSNEPCILDHLGKVLVVSNHHDPKSCFEEIEAVEGPNLQFTVKDHSRITGAALKEFYDNL